MAGGKSGPFGKTPKGNTRFLKKEGKKRYTEAPNSNGVPSNSQREGSDWTLPIGRFRHLGRGKDLLLEELTPP